MTDTSSASLKVLFGVILLIAAVDAVALGNLPPWSDWNYGERELRKRSTGIEVEKELTELETRGKRGKKNKLDRPLLSIETKNGGKVFATKSRRIDVPDAVAIDVVCGSWEVCSTHNDEDSCVDMDSNCPCRKDATTSNPTSIFKVRLLRRRDCD